MSELIRERIRAIRRITVPNAATRVSSQPPPSSENSRMALIQQIQHFQTQDSQIIFPGHLLATPGHNLDRPREGHPTYRATPGPLSEGRGGGLFIPPCIARRASLTRFFWFFPVSNLALFSLFHVATATSLRKLAKRRTRKVGRRCPRRLWNRGLLARHYT